MNDMKTFTQKVLEAVRAIPKGETRTYAQIAAQVGNPGAVRAVGSLMKKNFDPTVPCHRVIRSDGKVGEYNRGGAEVKARMLRFEREID